jgi:serine/threonine-protein kinase
MATQPFDVEATRRAMLQTLEAEDLAQTLASRPQSTLVPSQALRTAGKRMLETLSALGLRPPALRDEGELGSGGMGVVRLATQLSLDRQVAVKTLRPDRRSAASINALLGEAWLAGVLEHPNVVPVHEVGLDESGAPVLVMKRIEGVTWATLLKDARAMELHAPGRPPLEEHLRILIQVCNAVHYAHARGIVHRDVKPSNVMVGNFGEVYLSDWGIAATPGPSRQLAGTPAYLAPEMLGGEDAVLSPRTDVYLLGAVLFEVLAGKPPHDASSHQALVDGVLGGTPALPPPAPQELAALVRRCMQRDALLRPQSALEVRRALEDFFEHQGSLQLAEESQQRVEQLRALLAAPARDPVALENLFAQARFGFQQSLRTWPQNPRAREGLTQVLRAMARHALQAGQARTAQSLLRELPERDADLEAAVAVAIAQEEERKAQLARLQQLERQLDPRTGGRLRMTVGLGLAAVWAATPLIGKVVTMPGSALTMLGIVPLALMTGLVLMLVARGSGSGSLINQRVLRVATAAMFCEAFLLSATYLLVGDLGAHTLPLVGLYWGVVTGAIAVAMEPRFAPTPVGFFASLLLMLRFPQWQYELVAANNAVLALNVGLMWRALRAK